MKTRTNFWRSRRHHFLFLTFVLASLHSCSVLTNYEVLAECNANGYPFEIIDSTSFEQSAILTIGIYDVFADKRDYLILNRVDSGNYLGSQGKVFIPPGWHTLELSRIYDSLAFDSKRDLAPNYTETSYKVYPRIKDFKTVYYFKPKQYYYFSGQQILENVPESGMLDLILTFLIGSGILVGVLFLLML